MGLSRSPPEIRSAFRSHLLVPAFIALFVGIGGIAFGLTHDDIVTALGVLLFLPSAVLLFGIVAKRHGVKPFAPSSNRAN
ncbi:hypothetical protein EKH57_16795 [Halorubrum sp. BOL3-1]|uniref:hypothetical protein n=1 Tax=Halorubrum sp. BOL3-1 TaxID=2497325 RepID=UPI001004D819|nr:hypothetical protein [Halorubrum sp. BOL3-1]QAU14190.1 hypothetical protein EKH57_16795 [Halorubrum sp. BOL3-1]